MIVHTFFWDPAEFTLVNISRIEQNSTRKRVEKGKNTEICNYLKKIHRNEFIERTNLYHYTGAAMNYLRLLNGLETSRQRLRYLIVLFVVVFPLDISQELPFYTPFMLIGTMVDLLRNDLFF